MANNIVKFNLKAASIYGVSQTAENQPAIIKTLASGTITVSLAGTAVVGVGTAFLTQVDEGYSIYTDGGVLIGKVTAVTDDLNIVIEPAQVAVTGGAYATSDMLTTGTATVAGAGTALVGVGTAFLTELAIGIYVYDQAGLEVGQVISVADDTNAVISAAANALSAEVFQTGMGAKNALAVTELNFAREITSEAFVYLGDELSRDEETVVTDSFVTLDFQTFLKKLGTIAGADPVESEVPLLDWMQSSGMAVVLSTGSQGTVTYTNSQVTNEYMTIEIRRSSPDIGTDKVYTVKDARATIDMEVKVGTKGTLKFNYQANLISISQKPKLVADYQNQKFNTAGTWKTSNITKSNLELYPDSGIEPTVGDTNFCFDNASAPNYDGFVYDRYQTSCQEGWSKEANPTDLTLTIIEDEAGAIYAPQDHLEDLHRLEVNSGTVAGERVSLVWTKIQLANVSSSEVAKYAGEDLLFRNVGHNSIIIN